MDIHSNIEIPIFAIVTLKLRTKFMIDMLKINLSFENWWFIFDPQNPLRLRFGCAKSPSHVWLFATPWTVAR